VTDQPNDPTEQTMPLGSPGAIGPRPTWTPPPSTTPLPTSLTPVAPPAAHRRSGWLWPVVASVALVLGVVGGVAGSAVYDRIDENEAASSGLVPGGLDQVDTVALPPLKAEDGTVANVAAELLPSTVQISAEYDGDERGATGSGFVLDEQGHIITNNHVVEQAAEDDGVIEIVDQDGNRYDATVVGRSPVYDLAVLYSEDAQQLRPASLGASKALRIGEGVVAIGSPLGLSSTVTAGIVSALDRPVTTGDADASSYINAVQTDAAINPGNSGGPLVNLLGQVVGVNSAIATAGGIIGGDAGNIGVGFAIPIEQVRVTADQILETGEARYPVIGAKVRTGGADGDGALIDSVVDGQPAEDAGLEEGDLVVALEGERVTDGIALIVAIRTHQPGETLAFTVERDGDEQVFDVTLDSEVG
jgi:putative serine protease PepD